MPQLFDEAGETTKPTQPARTRIEVRDERDQEDEPDEPDDHLREQQHALVFTPAVRCCESHFYGVARRWTSGVCDRSQMNAGTTRRTERW
jgi:hypothetical protein